MIWHPARRVRKDGQPYAPNHWHHHLMVAYSAAAWHHWQAMEEATYLYETEVREYLEQHPRPQLKAMMVELARGWADRGAVA